MKKLVLFIFITLSYFDSISAQCPQGDITLSTQQEIDDFTSTYPGCTDLSGNLIIIEDSYISNLNGLGSITSVSGNLVIEKTHAPTLTGLENLTSVGKYRIRSREYRHISSL